MSSGTPPVQAASRNSRADDEAVSPVRVAKSASLNAPPRSRDLQELVLDAFEAIPEGIVIYDAEDRIVGWNKRYAEIYEELGFSLRVGKKFEDLLRDGLSRNFYPSAIGREEEWLAARMERHRRSFNEHEQLLASGKWVRIQERRSRSGGSVGIRIDITDLKQKQAELLSQRGQLNDAVETMSQGLLMFDREGRLLLHNTQYATMYQIPDGIIQPGMRIVELVELRERYGTFRGDPHDHCAQLFAALEEGQPTERMIDLPDGRCIYAVSRPTDAGGFVITHADVTELRDAQASVQYLAEYDSLTQLANRSNFNSSLESALRDATEADEQVALIFLDVDRFKEINDVFGHITGDAFLKALGGKINAAAGGSLVSRLGGDEFSILIRRADEAQVRALAEDILDLANQEVTVGEHLIKSGISIGVAFFPRDGMDAVTLLANADAALYRAKQGGRRSIRVFDAAMDQEIREKWSLVQQLRTAVSRNEFLLHFQPQLRIGHEIVGFEALLRWQHPIRGMLRPDLFIPLAEESGAILEIGEWALRSACEEASRWSSDFRVSVNLSPVQFRVGNIVRSVHQALIDTGISPRRLQLEITESVFIDDFERALSILRQLKNIGATIAMDDFGTGYSSLSYLQSFPFDRIKIDRQFVSQLPSNPQSATIVRAIVGLAKGLGLPVTAEGVETREQLEFLQYEGCDEAQGYLIGRPQPSSAYGTMAQGLDPTQSLAAG